MRALLLRACDFNWDAISPAIFGALFQSVMDGAHRRAQGAHYTTERNILKVIEPLFLDGLRDEFQRIKERRDTGRRGALDAFQTRLASLRFFDPACGCGNFLVIAYRELRALELEVLRELFPPGQQVLDVEQLVRVNVSQFYGIEIGEFPARIAEVALWMMDHIANNRVSLLYGQVFRRIPLRASPHIRHADALETDWQSVLPAGECDFLLGNPPFIGAKYQTPVQREQVRRVALLGGSGGTLDYVTAWFLTAGAYARAGKARIGFVSTNSITQGEQVAQLWPLLFDRYGLELAFAHATFAWGSDARGMAHVHVVILGLTRREDAPRAARLFTYTDQRGDPTEIVHAKLSPYLIDAGTLADPHLVVREVPQPINGLPRLIIGSQPIDGGHLIFTPEEREAFLNLEPGAAPFLRPYIGAEELINGSVRYILALQKVTPNELRRMPYVLERLEKVRQYRGLKASALRQSAVADTPAEYFNTVLPDRPFLAIPEVSSERREYAPIAYLEPPTVPSNLVRVLPDVPSLAIRPAHVSDAHGLAADHRRPTEKRLPLLHRHYLQHLPAAPAVRRRQDAAGGAGPSHPGRPRRVPGLLPGRPLRPLDDAPRLAEGASGAGYGRGTAVSPAALRRRPGAGRASADPVRGPVRPAAGGGTGEGEEEKVRRRNKLNSLCSCVLTLLV